MGAPGRHIKDLEGRVQPGAAVGRDSAGLESGSGPRESSRMDGRESFARARELLMRHRTDYETACRAFQWPRPEAFNWAFDWFDRFARGNDAPALVLAGPAGVGETISFDGMARRSAQAANFLARFGVSRGDRVLLMLDNVPAMWECLLGLMKLGAVIVPTTTQMHAEGIAYRVETARVKHLIVGADGVDRCAELPAGLTRIAVGGAPAGWRAYADAYAESGDFTAPGPTRGDEVFLLYFTSGTTSRPKLVAHTHLSYPVGHLSTMYWIGLREGDRHLNISSPGWAKHAWSSVFAPWNAGAAVVALEAGRFDPAATLALIRDAGVTTLCAPPTVWRLFIQQDLASYRTGLRELVGAGEPLNPEVIERVRRAWGLTIRDGYGQTETTAQIANPPGRDIRPGAMGRPLPGYRPVLLAPDGSEADEGELALRLDPPPVGLMKGYDGDPDRTAEAMADGVYRTGDVARRDGDGEYWYVGRADDVFKSSDYRISPFELESALIEFEAVAEAAVVPSPHPTRLAVPKAYVALREGFAPDASTARAIFRFARERLAPYQRIRLLEFQELPKTISGKIRRVELRRHAEDGSRGEFREEDLPG